MNNDSNPFTPPSLAPRPSGSFAPRYRIDNSKATLKEFINISRKPILGTAVWLALKIGLLKMNQGFVDSPRPFAEDQCALEDIPEPAKAKLLECIEQARRLGFHSATFSVKTMSGVEATAAQLRMLHRNEQCFYRAIFAFTANGTEYRENVASATIDPLSYIVSSNGRPDYHPPSMVREIYFRGLPLNDLFRRHMEAIATEKNLVRIQSFEDTGEIIDRHTKLSFVDLIDRGIFVAIDYEIVSGELDTSRNQEYVND
ncbi:MAG: hypothetical protein R3C03_03160 [Pirellulaceae bacterium]